MFSSLGPSAAEKESTLLFTTKDHLKMGKLKTKTEEFLVQFDMKKGEYKDEDEQKAHQVQQKLKCEQRKLQYMKKTSEYIKLKVVGQDSNEKALKVSEYEQKAHQVQKKIQYEQRKLQYMKKTAEYIKLKLVGQDSNKIRFRVKQTTQMGKLRKSYSERVEVPVTSLRFLFDGRRINDDESMLALEKEMEEDKVIEVYQEQDSGGL